MKINFPSVYSLGGSLHVDVGVIGDVPVVISAVFLAQSPIPWR